jgi:hypothetical protein
MSRYLAFTVLLLALVFAPPADAADNSSGASDVVHTGGLSCFSIRPPDKPVTPETKHTPPQYRSCDELCAANGAACTATTSTENPMRSCASTDYPPGGSTLCRCCAVAR